MPYGKTPINLTHPFSTKKSRKNVAKKTTDAAVDFIIGPIGQIPGVKNKVQSLKNKKNRALGLGVNYKEAYVDADKNKYPTQESFTKAAKAYNNSPTEMSAELMYNAVDDITQGKGKGDFPFTNKHTSNSASMMVDKSSPAGMHSPMHEGHKGSAMPMYGPAKMYGKKK